MGSIQGYKVLLSEQYELQRCCGLLNWSPNRVKRRVVIGYIEAASVFI